MQLPRFSRRQKAALAVTLALLLWVPQGISSHEHTVVTGHSTFYNGDAYDPCLGSIAGIMRSRVMWFNDQVLVERYGGEGTFIYVTEAGAPDPRAELQMFSEGVFYDFVDPNGAHWHIEELYYEVTGFVGSDFDADGTMGVAPSVSRVGYGTDRYTTWVVELSSRPIYDQFAGDDPHTYYNFLTLVDTCKMHRDQSYHGQENHTIASGKLNDRNGHESGAAEHEHETFLVNLWVGKRPVFALSGASTDGAAWESSWAASEARQSANETGESDFEGYLP